MNDNIKSAYKIYDELHEAKGKEVAVVGSKKWVSLGWLKEQIKDRNNSRFSPIEQAPQFQELEWVLSLLGG